MLEYSDFYNIASYGNKNWKGSFTPKEIACYAYDYYEDYKQSGIRGKLVGSMPDLLELLKQDKANSTYWIEEELTYWIEEIEKSVDN